MNKVIDIANYLITLEVNAGGAGLTNLKLQKLAYYCQGFHLAIENGTAAFDESIEAWQYGPVVPDLYQVLKCYGSSLTPIPTNFDPNIIAEPTRDIIEEVFQLYGQFSAWRLRDLTHEDKPWIDHEASRSEIPKSELTEFFKSKLKDS